MPVTSKPSDNTDQTIHAGRAIRTATSKQCNRNTNEDRAGRYRNQTKQDGQYPSRQIIKMDPARSAELIDGFILSILTP